MTMPPAIISSGLEGVKNDGRAVRPARPGIAALRRMLLWLSGHSGRIFEAASFTHPRPFVDREIDTWQL
jgi:hypothetical protein